MGEFDPGFPSPILGATFALLWMLLIGALPIGGLYLLWRLVRAVERLANRTPENK